MYDPTMRVLTVLELLQAKERVTGAELERRLEVSRRSVQRYVARLQDLGVPVESNRGVGGGYRLRPGFRLPPMMFTEEEAFALTLGLQALRQLGLAAMAPASEGAAAKLSRVLPQPVRERAVAVDEAVALETGPWIVPTDADTVLRVAEAIRGRHTVAFGYTSHQRTVSTRTVDPYGLVHLDGRWYLVGHCHTRTDMRTFRLDRVAELVETADAFTRPDDFDARAYLLASLPFVTSPHEVEVWLDLPIERARGRFMPWRVSLQEDEGGTRLRCARDSLEPFAAMLLGLGCGVRVARPVALREAFAALAERAASAAAAEAAPAPASPPEERAPAGRRASGCSPTQARKESERSAKRVTPQPRPLAYPAPMAPQFWSEHFRLERIGDGVWAALHQAGGWAVGNAGIVDLGNTTLVFDATITPEAGADLRRAAVALTGRPPAYVALSHYHNDHVRGAQSFPDAVLVSSAATRSLIGTLGRDELASDLEHGSARLAQARAHAASDDASLRAFGAAFVPYWEALIATAPNVSVRLPDLTFEDRAAWHGSRRSAEIISLGAAHTPDDAILYLPEDGIVFCGDLLFVVSHPYLADGDPEGWLSALERMSALDARVFVPGHGPIGSKGSLATLSEHIRGLLAEAERLRRERVAPDVIESAMPDDESVSWEFAFPFYRANLRFLLARDR